MTRGSSASTLLILAGLPGVGKSTLARGVAARLKAVYLRIDSIERALAESSLRIAPAADAGRPTGWRRIIWSSGEASSPTP